ncbi:MAG: DUF1552 domain-containing protein [Lentisphaeraceae bacterium]|nr:DUF1552 domain-containing protein [Lentisphaeraceae bacterium]
MINKKETFWIPKKPLSRRHLLKGLGVALSLPYLGAMANASASQPPKRMVNILTNMGILPQYFFPENTGADYQESHYLELTKNHRQDYTVFSGLSHPEIEEGHWGEVSFLTGAKHPGRSGFKNSISMDVLAAESIGERTRFPYMSMIVGTDYTRGLSFNRNGIMIPPEKRASTIFKKMFLQGSRREIDIQKNRLADGKSILDLVYNQAKSLSKKVGHEDSQKVAQYLNSVREAEKRIQASEDWLKRTKPKTSAKLPKDLVKNEDILNRMEQMYEMVALALESDSSRIVSLFIEIQRNPKVKVPGEEIDTGWHSLTHHNKKEEKLRQLAILEGEQFKILNKLLTRLKNFDEQGQSLLDNTMLLYGTHMGDAYIHSNNNLPVLLAGGGFKHGRHLDCQKQGQDSPLSNLYVSMLNKLGVPTKNFASSNDSLSAIEV